MFNIIYKNPTLIMFCPSPYPTTLKYTSSPGQQCKMKILLYILPMKLFHLIYIQQNGLDWPEETIYEVGEINGLPI